MPPTGAATATELLEVVIRVEGIKSFYVPRSKPEGFSVNVRCVDDGAVRVTRIMMFDGEHWEEAMAKLAEVREG